MKKFQIILANPKTEEIKIRNVVYKNFASAVSEAYVLSHDETKMSSGDAWNIIAIYDMEYKFDLTRPTGG